MTHLTKEILIQILLIIIHMKLLWKRIEKEKM